MGYFDKLAELGFMVVCRRNQLGTTTMFAVRDETDYQVCEGELLDLVEVSRSGRAVCVDSFDALLDRLPEWRVVDFVGDDAETGARLLYGKLTMTGSAAKAQDHLASKIRDFAHMQIGFEHRPESERFQPVDA